MVFEKAAPLSGIPLTRRPIPQYSSGDRLAAPEAGAEDYARDALYRANHISWWKEELPSEEEYQEAGADLEKHSWEVDYIITRCCPTSVQDELGGGFYQADAPTDFLEEIAQRCQFTYWFFGHYHDNGIIRKKYVLLYEQILEL